MASDQQSSRTTHCSRTLPPISPTTMRSYGKGSSGTCCRIYCVVLPDPILSNCRSLRNRSGAPRFRSQDPRVRPSDLIWKRRICESIQSRCVCSRLQISGSFVSQIWYGSTSPASSTNQASTLAGKAEAVGSRCLPLHSSIWKATLHALSLTFPWLTSLAACPSALLEPRSAMNDLLPLTTANTAIVPALG